MSISNGAWEVMVGAMTSWHQAKLFFEHGLDISHDALHVLVGVLAWLLVAVIVRRPLSSWTPWLALAAMTAFNEAVDLWNEQWPDPGMQYGEGAKDLVLTLFLPTLMLLAVRYLPGMFRQSARGPARRSKRRR